MSGQQIGTIVGGAIGAYFGGPVGAQLGMAIGGFIGGAIDPTQINGPHIGDGQQQTATDGSPIAWVQGTSPFIAGTIIEAGPRREVKIKDSGKGGPTVSHYEARQSFAILICESSEIKGSTIDSVLMVEQDGKIVYDVREGSAMLTQSFQWAKNVDFQFGAEDQLPHPTIEAIHGVGNTNPYRGRCIAVFNDFNITASGNRIPTFRFVVASAATSTAIDNVLPDDTHLTAMPNPGHIQDRVIGSYQDIAVDPICSNQIRITALPNWANYKYSIIPLYGTVIEGTTQLLTNDDVIPWLSVDGIYSTGWRDYFGGSSLPPDMEVWFASIGSAVPVVAGGAVSTPIDLSISSRPTGYRILELWYFGGFDVVPAAVGFKTPDPNGLSLSVYDKNYYIGDDLELYRPSWKPAVSMTIQTAGVASLAGICEAVCVRGGLAPSEYDVSELEGITVAGYPIAKQANAADCLAPLLAAYFAYAAEYDGKLHFRLYGADADVTVSRDDIVESDSGDDDASIIATKRGQATEYPRKITVSYYDPAQNYMVVNITNERISSDVQAIGEQTLPIPVVMTANDAARAAAKAMKVAYARLEGTREYAVPFVGADGSPYLSLSPGDAVILDGKRWSVDEMRLSDGVAHLKTTYSRQSAFTSNIQAIPGNAPTPPASTLPGATNLLPVNLPSLRPQDSFGIYVAASGALQSWPGATVQISYDGGMSWSNAYDTTFPCTMGGLTSNESAGTLSVKVNDSLDSVTDTQIAVGANAAVVVGPDGSPEILQFKSAAETSMDHYALSGLTRGLLGTTSRARTAGDQFALLDAVHFIPIAASYAGITLMLRGVTYGTAAEDAEIVSIVFQALSHSGDTDPILLEDGSTMLTELGAAFRLEM